MPRISDVFKEDSDTGKVVVEPRTGRRVEVFYIPSSRRLERLGLKVEGGTEPRAKLLFVDGEKQSMTVFPIKTAASSSNPIGFLGQKYGKIRAITISHWDDFEGDIGKVILASEGYGTDDSEITDDDLSALNEEMDGISVMQVLEALPPCYVKDYDYGLGFTKRNRFIIEAVEGISDATEIVISQSHPTGRGPDDTIFYISTSDFMRAINIIDRTVRISQTAARSVNSAEVRNLFAEKVGIPLLPVKTGLDPLRKKITEAATIEKESLSLDDQEELIDTLTRYTKSLATAKPEKLATLRGDIELVSLERLIEDYERMMKKRLNEKIWQKFLNANPFILSLAFSCPVVVVGEQASVGGRRFSGKGDTITDFLVKNKLTNNCMAVEIKTPNTKLFNDSPYREGVYTPSKDLAGALNQALDQKYHLGLDFVSRRNASREMDLEAYSIRSTLIVGTLPSDEDKKKSFELFRGNSKDVEVITFDELLGKLKTLKDLLSSEGTAISTGEESFDPPF